MNTVDQSQVCEAQLLGKELESMQLARRGLEVSAGRLKGAQMPRAREEYRLAGRIPTRRLQNRRA